MRFMSVPGDTAAGGRSVAAGSVMEWIDKAGYACAVGWAGTYCVTAYVGNVRHRRPIAPGSLIEVAARIIHTGRTSMHVVVTVSSSDVNAHAYTPATTCILIFVAKGADGRPAAVPAWTPKTRSDQKLAAAALERIPARTEIKRLMLDEDYTDAGEAPRTTLRFLVPPGVVNWGGNAHGGTVMRWIDEAVVRVRGVVGDRTATGRARRSRSTRAASTSSRRSASATSWSSMRGCIYTGQHSMHISIRVSSADPRTPRRPDADDAVHERVRRSRTRRRGAAGAALASRPPTEDLRLAQHAQRDHPDARRRSCPSHHR